MKKLQKELAIKDNEIIKLKDEIESLWEQIKLWRDKALSFCPEQKKIYDDVAKQWEENPDKCIKEAEEAWAEAAAEAEAEAEARKKKRSKK